LANSKLIMIFSRRPVVCEGLKQIIEEIASCRVEAVCSDKISVSAIADSKAQIIIIGRPDVRIEGLDYLFQHLPQVTTLVTVGWEDDKTGVYTRQVMPGATLRNIVDVIARSGVELKQCLPIDDSNLKLVH